MLVFAGSVTAVLACGSRSGLDDLSDWHSPAAGQGLGGHGRSGGGTGGAPRAGGLFGGAPMVAGSPIWAGGPLAGVPNVAGAPTRAGAPNGGAGGAETNCCAPHGSLGCKNPGIEQCVCSWDPLCCQASWDEACVAVATSTCNACGGGGIGGGGTGSGGGPTGGAPPGRCCEAHSAPGCLDSNVQNCVCANDPYCCEQTWDAACVAQVSINRCGSCGTGGAGAGPGGASGRGGGGTSGAGRGGRIGRGGASGAGGGGITPAVCADAAPGTCSGCLCSNCYAAFDRCLQDTCCLLFLDCSDLTGCQGADCAREPGCQSVVQFCGGPMSRGLQGLQRLRTCANAANCDCR